MINNREQDDGEPYFICQPLAPSLCIHKMSFGPPLMSVSLSHLSAFSTCIVCLLSSFLSITYRIQEHTVNPVHDAIALCILTVRSIHSDEIREKQMSQLSAVYSAEAAVPGKALHGDVHTRHKHFFDGHLFLLRDKCQVVARLLDMGDLMCT